jgi:hypothetical protein
MTQIDFLFNDTESRRRKREGMTRAVDTLQRVSIVVLSHHKHYLLNKAREIAREIAARKGETNSDEVSIELARRGYPDCIGPAAGSIFKSGDFVFTGRFVNSTRVTNHSRLLRVWALRA